MPTTQIVERIEGEQLDEFRRVCARYEVAQLDADVMNAEEREQAFVDYFRTTGEILEDLGLLDEYHNQQLRIHPSTGRVVVEL